MGWRKYNNLPCRKAKSSSTDTRIMEQSTQTEVPGTRLFPPAIFLLGPTASGKSGAALEMASRLPVEIVSVDSAQVYRYMDIGTAKPVAPTRERFPHHLIDLVDPPHHYSAAQFVVDALAAMRDITGRGNIPLLVGGTMLYFRALLEGLSDLPPGNAEMRRQIEELGLKIGWPGMHQALQDIDPASAA